VSGGVGRNRDLTSFVKVASQSPKGTPGLGPELAGLGDIVLNFDGLGLGVFRYAPLSLLRLGVRSRCCSTLGALRLVAALIGWSVDIICHNGETNTPTDSSPRWRRAADDYDRLPLPSRDKS
jgi:hypothetical protein